MRPERYPARDLKKLLQSRDLLAFGQGRRLQETHTSPQSQHAVHFLLRILRYFHEVLDGLGTGPVRKSAHRAVADVGVSVAASLAYGCKRCLVADGYENTQQAHSRRFRRRGQPSNDGNGAFRTAKSHASTRQGATATRSGWPR